MHVKGGHSGGPDESLSIMMLLDDARHEPAQPNAVTAHLQGDTMPLLIEKVGSESLRIAGPQLKDVAHLDGPHGCQCGAARRTKIPWPCQRDVRAQVRLKVPGHVDVLPMESLSIGARDIVDTTLYGFIGHDSAPLDADR